MTQKLRIVTLRFGAVRQKMVLERWTNPKRSRRTCICEFGLPSCRGKSAGVAKRPRERSISHPKPPPFRFAKPFSSLCVQVAESHRVEQIIQRRREVSAAAAALEGTEDAPLAAKVLKRESYECH